MMPLQQSKSRLFQCRDMENIFRTRRWPYPKRSVEFIALIAVSCTLFLFLHTQNLNSRLHDMEIKMQPSELSALGLTGGNSLINDDSKHHDLKGLHGTYQYLKSTGQVQIINNTDQLNNTKNAEFNLVFFNRVPKVGSQTLMTLMIKLSELNHFNVNYDRRIRFSEWTLMNRSYVEELVEDMSSFQVPSVYFRHTAFINFTYFNHSKPIYINLVRDPIERIISWYYYVRTPGWYLPAIKDDDQFQFSENWLNKEFGKCFLENDPECIYEQNSKIFHIDHRRQVIFFCGHNGTKCIPLNSYEAMQTAKENVEREYAVVGSWEDTNITLSVFEHYLPLFFRNATNVYYDMPDSIRYTNRNWNKPKVPEEVKQKLRILLSNEIEFYQFCKKRLYSQYQALNLNTKF